MVTAPHPPHNRLIFTQNHQYLLGDDCFLLLLTVLEDKVLVNKMSVWSAIKVLVTGSKIKTMHLFERFQTKSNKTTWLINTLNESARRSFAGIRLFFHFHSTMLCMKCCRRSHTHGYERRRKQDFGTSCKKLFLMYIEGHRNLGIRRSQSHLRTWLFEMEDPVAFLWD